MATGTLGSQARDYPTRKYFISSPILFSNAVAGVKIGTVPAGAVITSIQYGTSQVFNGTTPTVRVGLSATGAELVAAATFGAALGLSTSTLIATAAGPLAADTDVWASGVFGGGQTTGSAVIFVNFLVPG